MKQEAISGAQLFAVLFVSRIIGLFTFTVPQETGFSAGDRVLFTLPFFLFCLLCAVPVFLTAKHPAGIVGLAGEVSPALAKTAGTVLCGAFLCAAALGVLRFELFVSTVMFPEGDTLLLTALLLAAASAAAVHGMQSLGRTASVLLALLAASMVFILLATADRFDPLNLTPPLESGVTPVLKNGFRSACRTMELTALSIAPTFTKGNLRKTGVGWLAVFTLTAAAVFFVIGGVTGRYGEQQMFQLYTVTAIARFGVFERLDAILTGLWILGAFLQAAFFLRLAATAVEQAFGKNLNAAPVFAGGGVVFALFLLFSTLAAHTEGAATLAASETVFLLAAVALPGTVILAHRIKKRSADDIPGSAAPQCRS